MKNSMTIAFALTALTGTAGAQEVFFQGFETDTAGYFDENNGWAGVVDRTASGTNSISSSDGSWHAIFTQSNTAAAGGTSGPFSRFDMYRDTFPTGGYTASVDIYLDTAMAAGEGFDYSVASSGSDNLHQRDFIFHVTSDTSSGQLLVGATNNSNFAPREDLETINHYAVPQSGWYTFEHVFRNDGGVLAVDLNLLDDLGNPVFTETRTTAADTIPGEVGGNRYNWFTHINVTGGIAVDNASLTLVPAPASAALLGLGGIAAVRRRR